MQDIIKNCKMEVPVCHLLVKLILEDMLNGISVEFFKKAKMHYSMIPSNSFKINYLCTQTHLLNKITIVLSSTNYTEHRKDMIRSIQSIMSFMQ